MENFNLLGWDESRERDEGEWSGGDKVEEREMEDRAEVRRGNRMDGMDEEEGWRERRRRGD